MTKTIKRTFAIVSALLLCFAILVAAGCSPETYEKTKKDAQLNSPDLISSGKLIVGLDAGNQPLAGQHGDQIVGIDVDVAAAIADELGLELEVKDIGTAAETSLSNKKVDIVLGASKSTTADNLWKSNIYLQTAPTLFSTKGNAAVPNRGDGKKFVSSFASASAEAISAQYDSGNIKAVKEIKEAFEMLRDEKVDFVAADAVIGTYTALVNDVEVFPTALLAPASGYCAEVSSEKTNVQDKVNNAIQTLINNGTIDVIQRKWLARTIQLENVPLTPGASNQASQTDLDSAVYGELSGTSKQN